MTQMSKKVFLSYMDSLVVELVTLWNNHELIPRNESLIANKADV